MEIVLPDTHSQGCRCPVELDKVGTRHDWVHGWIGVHQVNGSELDETLALAQDGAHVHAQEAGNV
jgi:hypothetical protein